MAARPLARVLLALALLLRLAVPAGYMPAWDSAHRLTIAICNGTATGSEATTIALPQRPGAPQAPEHDGTATACPYAALGLALLGGEEPTLGAALALAPAPASPARRATVPATRPSRWRPPLRAPPLLA